MMREWRLINREKKKNRDRRFYRKVYKNNSQFLKIL